jgi:hypothetical protein
MWIQFIVVETVDNTLFCNHGGVCGSEDYGETSP